MNQRQETTGIIICDLDTRDKLMLQFIHWYKLSRLIK